MKFTPAIFANRAGLVSGIVCVLLAFNGPGALAQGGGFEEQFESAQRALTAGKYAEAQLAFEQLAPAHPEIAEIHANLGLVYFEEKKFEQAIPELRRANRYSEALSGLEKGFRSRDRGMKRMCGLELVRAYSGLRQDDKAVEIALEMSRLYPEDPEVLYHNGKIFGNFAFLSIQKLSQVAPDSVWTHQAAAEAYESQSSYNAAIGEYRQVLAIEPQRPGVHYRLGRTLLARSRETSSAEDRGAAVKEFEQELKIDPLNASAAYEIGETHRNAGEFGDAQNFFELALKNYSDFEEAHLGLAAVLAYVGRPASALPHLQKAISLNPDNEVSWYRLSQIERSLGNMAEAQRAVAKFQQLHQHKTPQQAEAGKPLFSTDAITKQTLDADAPQ